MATTFSSPPSQSRAIVLLDRILTLTSSRPKLLAGLVLATRCSNVRPYMESNMMSGREPWEPNITGGYCVIVPLPQSMELVAVDKPALKSDTKAVFRAAGRSHPGGASAVGKVNAGKDDVTVGLGRDISWWRHQSR